MNIISSEKIQSAHFTDLGCPICGADEMAIDLDGWFHCEDCCALTPEAFGKLKGKHKPPVSMAAKAASIAAEFGYTMDHVRGQMRDSKISSCRAHIFYALHKDGFSFNQIGQLCHKDHSSVSYAVKKMQAALAKD